MNFARSLNEDEFEEEEEEEEEERNNQDKVKNILE